MHTLIQHSCLLQVEWGKEKIVTIDEAVETVGLIALMARLRHVAKEDPALPKKGRTSYDVWLAFFFL